MSLEDRTEEFHDETPDIPFSYIVGLFQDYQAFAPDEELGKDYWETIDEPDFPVVSDPEQLTISDTPYTGQGLPGKCVLSPKMRILECGSGHGEDDWAYDIIREHADR